MNTKPLFGTFLLLVIGSVISCSSPEVAEITPEANQEQEDKTELITITQSQFSLAGMLMGQLEMVDFHESVKTYGYLDAPPKNKASVSAYFGGYVKHINLLPGQKVNKGEVLFTLENPEYIHVQQEYLEIKSQIEYLKSDYERQKTLQAENMSSQKNLLKAEAEYNTSNTALESLKKQLTLMNIDPISLRAASMVSTISVKSPLDGFVTAVNANKGMYLDPIDVVTSITNSEELQIELDVFEKDIPKIKEGQSIRFQLQDDNFQKHKGSVFLVNKIIDFEKRTASVIGILSAETISTQFTPGMFVDAEILTNSDEVLALPLEAVVNIEDEHFVLLKMKSDSEDLVFEIKQVKIGRSNDGYIQILNAHEFDQKTSIFLLKGVFNLIQ